MRLEAGWRTILGIPPISDMLTDVVATFAPLACDFLGSRQSNYRICYTEHVLRRIF